MLATAGVCAALLFPVGAWGLSVASPSWGVTRIERGSTTGTFTAVLWGSNNAPSVAAFSAGTWDSTATVWSRVATITAHPDVEAVEYYQTAFTFVLVDAGTVHEMVASQPGRVYVASGPSSVFTTSFPVSVGTATVTTSGTISALPTVSVGSSLSVAGTMVVDPWSSTGLSPGLVGVMALASFLIVAFGLGWRLVGGA